MMSRWLVTRGPRFVIHRGYQLPNPFPHYDRRRPFRILGYLRKRGLLRRGCLRRPQPVSSRRLRRIHHPAYLNGLETPGAISEVVGLPLTPQQEDEFLEFQRLMVGGTVLATRMALGRRQIVTNLGGGLHHAAAASGSGFCLFNDVAVAIAAARHRGFDGPVLVIDLDLHDGDGTRRIFAEDPRVHTFSIHNRDLGDTVAIASTSVALGSEIGDAEYLAAIREHLPPVFAAVKPELVFYLAGADPWVDDRLGDWRITLEGMLERDRFVTGLVRDHKEVRVPTVVLLAGGYGPNAWRHGAAFFSWLLTGSSRLNIPLELELPVDHYRKLARLMRTPGIRSDETRVQDGAPAIEDWGLAEEDLAGVGGLPDTRFMGVFSRHGAEEALEEAGLLDRLRQKGFTGLHVGLDLTDPLGHMLRIHAGGPVPQVVFEMKLRVDRHLLRDAALLSVEWLLIQDARSSFELSRPLLPGQEFPGLGLLRDTAAVLIVAAERMGLDGLVFTPTHFHLASIAWPQGFFADPVMQARFIAMNEAVADLRMGEAARVLERGQVFDREKKEPAQWAPAPMVIPVGDRLKVHFAGEDYRRRVAAAEARFEFTRAP
jgi:acetoin utilization deacetylase AcuC-like enzyme